MHNNSCFVHRCFVGIAPEKAETNTDMVAYQHFVTPAVFNAQHSTSPESSLQEYKH